MQQLLDLINGAIPENSVNAETIAERYNEGVLFPPGKGRRNGAMRSDFNLFSFHRRPPVVLFDTRADMRGRVAKPKGIRIERIRNQFTN